MSKTFILTDVFHIFANKFSNIYDSIFNKFGMYGVWVLSLFGILILLILFIHVKSIIETFSSIKKEQESSKIDIFSAKTDVMTSNENEYAQTMDYSQENNDDTRPYLSMKLDEDNDYANKTNKSMEEKERELSKELIEKSAMVEDMKKLKDALKKQYDENRNKPFDWQKYNISQYENLKEKTNLSYQQQRETLEELVGLIINMLSRDVNMEKIAQAIYFRNQGSSSEEQVIHFIGLVKDFIGLCNSGTFDIIENRQALPSAEKALKSWALGNNGDCLELLEGLLNRQVELSAERYGLVKEMVYAQAANTACLMGGIAGFNNKELAENAYDLAIELAPQDVVAWNCRGNMYWDDNDKQRALYAYQKVLDYADDNLYGAEKANADKKMAEYYKEIGKFEKSDEFKFRSINFYKKYGINTKLTDEEDRILNFLISTQNNNLDDSINKLLNRKEYIL